MQYFDRLSTKAIEWFSLDYRSLALLRIGVGILLILDLANRAGDVVAHYSDRGVLPRSELFRLWNTDFTFSFHTVSGFASVELILFGIAGIIAFLLVIGYRTQLMMALSWLFLVSLYGRNPLVLQGGDIIFRAITFWMLFLPLNRVWSLDRLLNRVPRAPEKTILSGATIGYITQICIVYIFTALLKTGPAWHAEQSAIYYALNIDQLVRPLGMFLLHFPTALAVLTPIVWYIELLGVALFFSPIKTAWFRTAGIILFICLQLGFNLSLRIGLFGPIMIVIMFGLLPTLFWDSYILKVTSWLRKKALPGLSIYYDYDCSFCMKATNIIARMFFLHSETKILEARSNPLIVPIMESQNSWVIVGADGIPKTGWNGFIAIVAHSPFRWKVPFLSLWPINFLGEWCYQFVATHRHKVCIPEPEEQAPTPFTKKKHLARENIVLFFVAYTLLWNIETLGFTRVLSPQIEQVGYTLQMDQQFGMFAPTPLVEDGWYSIPAQTRNGKTIDLFTQEEPTTTKPHRLAYLYKNQRWQKYMMNLTENRFESFRLGYARYLCGIENKKRSYEEQIMSFDIIFTIETTPRPGDQPIPVRPVTLWKHTCF